MRGIPTTAITRIFFFDFGVRPFAGGDPDMNPTVQGAKAQVTTLSSALAKCR